MIIQILKQIIIAIAIAIVVTLVVIVTVMGVVEHSYHRKVKIKTVQAIVTVTIAVVTT